MKPQKRCVPFPIKVEKEGQYTCQFCWQTNYYVSKSQTERMVTMQVKDFFWRYFQQTGGIEAYLMYREMLEEDEPSSLKVALDEE